MLYLCIWLPNLTSWSFVIQNVFRALQPVYPTVELPFTTFQISRPCANTSLESEAKKVETIARTIIFSFHYVTGYNYNCISWKCLFLFALLVQCYTYSSLFFADVQFRLGRSSAPESVCSLPCELGQAKQYVEGESCCWHCFNCTQYQVGCV